MACGLAHVSERSAERRAALASAIAAGVGVLIIAVWLTVDAVRAQQQVLRDDAAVEALVERGQTDAGIAGELHDRYEQQTDTSLLREKRQRALSWALVAAAGVFLVSAKRLVSLGGLRPVLPTKQAMGLEAAGGTAVSAVLDVSNEPRSDDVDLSFVDEIVAQEGRGPEAAIPILQAIQTHYRYLPEASLRRVCELTDITPAQLTGVASFYTQFRRTPAGEHLVKVCHGTACHVAGAERISAELRRSLGIAAGEDTDPSRKFTVEPVACLGCCTLAPVVQINEETHGHLRADTAIAALRQHVAARRAAAEARRHVAADVSSAEERVAAGLRAGRSSEAVGEVRIGLGSCCVANGSARVQEALREAAAAVGASFSVKRVGCVGMCHQTPLVETVHARRTAGGSLYARVVSAERRAKTIIRRQFRVARPAQTARVRTATSQMPSRALT